MSKHSKDNKKNKGKVQKNIKDNKNNIKNIQKKKIKNTNYYDETDLEIPEKNSKKINTKKQKKHFLSKSDFRKLIVLFFIIMLILLILKIVSMLKWQNIAKQMVKNENSIIVDLNNTTIATLGNEKIHKNISFSEMPNNLINAYVSIEDERFYKHHGIDIKRTGAAILSYITHFGSSSFGGSSITQQLVKNLTGNDTSSISRKIDEWSKAIDLEFCLSKDEILESYLNIIYVGPNIYGVEMGAKYYFDKSASELTLEECAYLAGINHSPNSYNPFSETDKTKKITKRTKLVLNKMLELGYISNDEYNLACSNLEKGLNFKKGNLVSNSSSIIYSYHTDALISEAIEDIKDKYDISETFATNYLNMAGLTIYSTENSDIQKTLEEEFEKDKYILKSKNTENTTSQAAMIIIDHSKRICSSVAFGGLGKKTTFRGFNRATQGIRQTGSASKPLTTLVPGIDKKIFTSSTLYNDTKTTFLDRKNENYSPTNNSDYLGKITVRRAVESSQNIPFVQMIEQITPSTSIKYLEKMGITTLTEEDNNLALSLGGLEKGVSPLEMAGAYSCIANDGIYITPIFYTKIKQKDGKTLITKKQEETTVFSNSVAYILKDLLTEPVKGENGTAKICAISKIDTACKTGTTDDDYDRWLCGFTNYYTAVTWYGFDLNENIDFPGNQNPASVLWANVMKSIHKDLSGTNFEKPYDIITANICPSTGLLSNSNCPDAYEEYFLTGTVPKRCEEKHSSNNKSKKKNFSNKLD